MVVIKKELTAAFDVDGTLIVPDENGSIKIPYGSKICSFSPIMEHVDLLKSWKQRGYHITVWSHGGFRHALYVVEALKLERFVDVVCTKPCKHVDDRTDVESIVGTRVWLA